MNSESNNNGIEKTINYTIDKNIYIVESVFKADSADTLGEILLRLMISNKDS